MKAEFKKWLKEDYGLQESAATSRVSNISTIEKYYGDIDALIKSGKVHDLLKDLSYSTDDERNGREATHVIPINGNLRTGSATLKQALSRYIEFYQQTAEIPNNSQLKAIYGTLIETLSHFKPMVRKSSYKPDEVKEYIQLPLLQELKNKMSNIHWSMEYQPSLNAKDRIDIYGGVDDSTYIIIEIDTERADQVSKKFVSRQALSDDKNTIYVALTYPNENSNAESSRKELEKYKNYLASLNTLLGIGSNLEKYIYFQSL